MLWKITLVFCCALYCASGKSLLRHSAKEVKPVAQNEQHDIKDFFLRSQDIDETAQNVEVQKNEDDDIIEDYYSDNVNQLKEDADWNIENLNDINDGLENVNEKDKNQINSKQGYSLVQSQNNDGQYGDSIGNQDQNIPQPESFDSTSDLTASQFPREEIQALVSRKANQYFAREEETKANNAVEVNPVEHNDIETKTVQDFKNDAEMNDFMNIIQNDQQENKEDKSVLQKLQDLFQVPNDQDNKDIPLMFQGFQKMLSGVNFKPDQLFGPKTKPNVPNFNSQSQQVEPKVGVGMSGSSNGKLKVTSLTAYVRKAVTNARTQLKSVPYIIAHNPPLVINDIPGVQIIFKLKYLEGASSITPFGDSKGIYYNKLYAFTEYKLEQLKYYYDVQIRPLGLFGITTPMNIVIEDSPAKMQVSVEKDKKMNLLHFEFVKPNVRVDIGSRLANYVLNYYVINHVHPVVKNKIVEIVSRDSKLMLESFVKEAQ